jgi:hypothetical protein
MRDFMAEERRIPILSAYNALFLLHFRHSTPCDGMAGAVISEPLPGAGSNCQFFEKIPWWQSSFPLPVANHDQKNVTIKSEKHIRKIIIVDGVTTLPAE